MRINLTVPISLEKQVKAKIELPEDWTKQDIKSFLKYLKPDPKDKEERDSILLEDQEHHCWRNEACLFWQQDGDEEYQGHCSIFSYNCLTAVLNHKKPLRWLPKEE